MFETLALTDKEYLSLLGPDGNLKDTASQAPLHVVGIAYAEKLKASGRIVLTFMGEGATSQGVVFYVKNNQWAISLPTEKRTAGRTLAEKACAYGFESIRVDGNDLLAVYAATIAGARIAREKGRPVPIEGYTYRLGAHTTADDPKLYRDETQVAAWLDKDPLIRLEKYLAGKGLLTGKAQAELAAAALEVPLVVRMPYGGGIGAPAHHSESPEGPQSFGVAAEIPSPRSGVIRKLGAGPDQPVRVGEILARIEIADGKDSSSERKAVSAAQRLVRRRAADRRASRQGQHRFRHGYRAGPGRTGRRKGGRADPVGDPGTGRPAPLPSGICGSFGGTYGRPMILPPQVAVLGLGRIHQAPVAREGQLAVAAILPLSFVFDHRVCDGSYAVRFLNRFIELVSKPIRILR